MSQTWGIDNFANEGAMNYLQILAAKLLATIHEIYHSDDRLDLDEDGESMFMPSIELLALLCERYNIEPPKPSSVLQWQEKYIHIFDTTVTEINPDAQYQAERRKVIEKTFRWLMSLSETYWA